MTQIMKFRSLLVEVLWQSLSIDQMELTAAVRFPISCSKFQMVTKFLIDSLPSGEHVIASTPFSSQPLEALLSSQTPSTAAIPKFYSRFISGIKPILSDDSRSLGGRNESWPKTVIVQLTSNLISASTCTIVTHEFAYLDSTSLQLFLASPHYATPAMEETCEVQQVFIMLSMNGLFGSGISPDWQSFLVQLTYWNSFVHSSRANPVSPPQERHCSIVQQRKS